MACITGCKLIVTKKIAIGNLRKIIVTLYYNLWDLMKIIRRILIHTALV
jgi:hypothetical protein